MNKLNKLKKIDILLSELDTKLLLCSELTAHYRGKFVNNNGENPSPMFVDILAKNLEEAQNHTYNLQKTIFNEEKEAKIEGIQ